MSLRLTDGNVVVFPNPTNQPPPPPPRHQYQQQTLPNGSIEMFDDKHGTGKQNIIAVHFKINDPEFNTSQKRMNFIKKLGVEPMKRQHKTSSQYRYRVNIANPNKKHFTRKKNGVNIIYEGGGIMDAILHPIDTVRQLVWGADQFNYKSKETLKKYGSQKITAMIVARTPLSKTLNTAIDTLALGKFSELVKEKGYDKLFHLSLIIYLEDGTMLIYEKNESVDIEPRFNSSSLTGATEIEQIFSPINLTLDQFVNNAVKFMGIKDYFSYQGFSNNCQMFLVKSLQASNLLTPDLKDFIYQDFTQIRQELKDSGYGHVEKVMDAITETGAKTSILTGKGTVNEMLKDHINKSAEKLHKIICSGEFKPF
jgi:hypothetical protein